MPVNRTFTIAVASGKGGTGKTMVATGIAAFLAEEGRTVALADCDVEAPNAHLFLKPASSEVTPVEALVAEVDDSACTACGACRDACAFGALRVLGSSAMVFEELCHGCGLCTTLCPPHAIREVRRRVGEVAFGPVEGRDGLTLVSGRLDVGQVKTPAVIREVRAIARGLDTEYLVLDAPPGVACAAVASVRDADALLLVTEPTPFGLHDLELSVRLGHDLGLTMAVIANRTHDGTGALDAACQDWGIPVIARIAFSREIAEAYAAGGVTVDSITDVRTALAPVAGTLRALTPRSAGAIA